MAYNQSGRQKIGMPSQVVDFAWHEFILFTRDYSDFCDKAFRSFLHHAPAESSTTKDSKLNKMIAKTWVNVCLTEKVKIKQMTVLPLLFGIDALLKIENGFIYDLEKIKTSSNRENFAGGGCGGG